MFRVLVVLVWPAAYRYLGSRPRCWPDASAGAGPAPAAARGQRQRRVAALRGARSSIIGMLLILVVGAVAVYGVTCLLGVLVVHAGPSIDKPIYTWMIHHREHFWKAVMNRLTKVGNTWTTWGAAAPRPSAWPPSTGRTNGCPRWLSARPSSSTTS